MISGDFGGDVKEDFWLTGSVLATIPVSSLQAISERDDVASVVPNSGIGGPAGFALSDGRARVNSDRWYDLITNTFIGVGGPGGTVAFVDSGARTTHTLLGSNVTNTFDCVVSLPWQFLLELQSSHRQMAVLVRPALHGTCTSVCNASCRLDTDF